MNQPDPQPPTIHAALGFTLVELVVVIAVITLLVDMNILMQIPGVPGRGNHHARRVVVGQVDGRAEAFDNTDQAMSLRPQDVMRIADRLDEIFMAADGVDF